MTRMTEWLSVSTKGGKAIASLDTAEKRASSVLRLAAFVSHNELAVRAVLLFVSLDRGGVS